MTTRQLLAAIAIGALTLSGPLPRARADEPTKKENPPKQEPAKPAPPAPIPAQGAPQKTDPQKTEPARPAPAEPTPAPATDAPKPDGTLPSLDAMLGLETEKEEDTKKLLDDYDPDKVQLERVLTDQEAAEKLQQAVQQMHESAFRLEEIRDSGIVTQRLQAEILTKLDMLIKNAESQDNSSSSGSSQPKPGEQNQQSPGQKGAQPSDSNNDPKNATGDQDHTGGPAFQQGQREQFEAAKAAWGALPERVRDRLLEGSGDDFSQWYEDLTKAYYKAIADEASKK